MEIQLEEPFKSSWRKGYKVFDKTTGRYRVVFYNDPSDIGGMSFARYVMSVHLGYIVPSHLEVDHKDDNCQNDRIDNLQLLTPEQNRLKQTYRYLMETQNCYGFECAYCGMYFILTERQIKMRMAQNVEYAFCSNRCSISFYPPPTKSLGPELIAEIKKLRLEGGTSYSISSDLGIARNTVMKYW